MPLLLKPRIMCHAATNIWRAAPKASVDNEELERMHDRFTVNQSITITVATTSRGGIAK